LRFGLARLANPEGNKPWPVQPEVWALQSNGRAAPFEVSFFEDKLPPLVERLAKLAQMIPIYL